MYIKLNKTINLDGAYFGSGFPFALMQAYPDLIVDEIPEAYYPKLYGFKIFGQKGSKYEIKYDEWGTSLNKEETDKTLIEKKTDAYDQ